MFRSTPWILLCAIAAVGLRAQQTEVVLSATSSAKLVLALSQPKLAGLDEAMVAAEFTAVLKRDLDESGVFGVLQERLPADGAPTKAWKEAGAMLLLSARLAKAANGDLQLEASALDTSTEKREFTRTYNANRIVPLRYLAHYLSDDLVGRFTGEKGVASTRVVFVRQVSPGVKELFQVDRDGAGLVQLTRHGSLTLSPSVAPDGRLAYVTYKGGAPEIWGQRKKDGPESPHGCLRFGGDPV